MTPDNASEHSLDTTLPSYSNMEAYKRLGQADKTVDWSREATREAREETIVVSPDYTTIVLSNTLFVRPQHPHATLHLSGYWDNKEIYGPYDIEGAHADEELYVDNSSMFLRLNLPEDCARVHRVAYKYRLSSEEALTAFSITSLMSWPLRLYTCRLIFEGDLPNTVTWTLANIPEDGLGTEKTVVTRELEAVDNCFSFVQNDVGQGESVVSWS